MVAIAGVLTLAACGTTTIDDSVADDTAPSEAELTGGEDREIAADDTTPLAGGVIVDEDAPPSTLPAVGAPLEVLPEIGVDMSRLSSQISGDGEEGDAIDRMQANWTSIEVQVRSERPDLADNIQTTIDMAQIAVDENRPADADKAFSLLTDLIDSYTNDG